MHHRDLRRTRDRADDRNLNLDLERRDVATTLEPHLDRVRIDLDVLANDGEDFLAQNGHEIGLAAGAALVRQQNLQAFTRRRGRLCLAAGERSPPCRPDQGLFPSTGFWPVIFDAVFWLQQWFSRPIREAPAAPFLDLVVPPLYL